MFSNQPEKFDELKDILDISDMKYENRDKRGYMEWMSHTHEKGRMREIVDR